MNKNLLMFVAGATIGSFATFIFVKKKYEILAQEEIDSVKESFKTYCGAKEQAKCTMPDNEKPKTEIVKCQTSPDESINKQDYDNIVKRYSKPAEPFVISPEEFGELKTYKLVGLTYFADRVLADDNGNIVDIETVGAECLKQFGEYEDDSVHIRNKKLKTDYEVLLDPRKYSEVYKKRD